MLTVTKEITIINIIVTDGSGTAVPATGNSLADGPVMLTAELEGLTTGVSFAWACAPATPGGSTNIDISAASGDSTTVSGTLGTATVTLTATYDDNDYNKTMEFRCQIGSKSAPDAVGDIVFSDGSASPYTDFDTVAMSSDQVAAAVAVIYDATNMKGVGLKQGTLKTWAANGSSGYSTEITTLAATKDSGSDASDAVFSGAGAADGSGSFIKLQQAILYSSSNHPAWEFVAGYHSTAGLTGTNSNGWYMPSIAELCTLYQAKTTVNAALNKISGAAQLAGNYWSSSQTSGNAQCAWRIDFDSGDLDGGFVKSSPFNVRAIRAF